MKLDKDVKKMSKAKRGKELQRLRSLIRTHKKRENNARCWMADVELYKKALPEGGGGAGRMDLPKNLLLLNCVRYISGQQRGQSSKSGI
jgi:hypothetical protein